MDQWCDVCEAETDHVFCYPETPDGVDAAAETFMQAVAP
jgi:hypothetical protein